MRRFLWMMVVLWPGAVAADAPRVIADIAPVHALVARVMAGVGAPDLLLQPGASPHTHAMRPSQAAALQAAEIVFWVGPSLTPWLERPLATIGSGAASVTLLDAGGTAVLPYRWGEEDHEGHDHGHAHAAGSDDPHAWLDPVNAEAWLSAIAAALSEADPAQAAVYAANATAGQAELRALQLKLSTQLSALQDIRLIVYHDAFQYFEARFGLTSIGAMTRGDNAPSPRDLSDLRDLVTGEEVCVVLEPDADPGLARAVDQAGIARHITLDPQGRALEPGPGFYAALLQSLAATLSECARS